MLVKCQRTRPPMSRTLSHSLIAITVPAGCFCGGDRFFSLTGHPGTAVYRNIKQYLEAKSYEGVRVFHVDAPIYFTKT